MPTINPNSPPFSFQFTLRETHILLPLPRVTARGTTIMLHVGNCFIPLGVFGLAELRAGASHIALLVVFGCLVRRCRPLTPLTAALLGLYLCLMFYVQRRLASGLGLHYPSLRAWRTSRHNFRVTSPYRAPADNHISSISNSNDNGGGPRRRRPVAVLTGGERGIGLEAAKQLALMGFDLFLCCPPSPDADRALAVVQSLGQKRAAHARLVALDLASEESVRSGAALVLREAAHIDVLINNAGILSPAGGKYRRVNSPKGAELVVAINFLGHVLWTELLLDRVRSTAGSRVVNVTSLLQLSACVPAGHTPLSVLRESCSPRPAIHTHNYSLSKLLLVCYTHDLARRLEGSATRAVSVHPGVVLTAIYDGWGLWALLMRGVMRTVFKFPGEGAEVVLYGALSADIRSGSFYADCRAADGLVSPLALDDKQNRAITDFARGHFGLPPCKDPVA